MKWQYVFKEFSVVILLSITSVLWLTDIHQLYYVFEPSAQSVVWWAVKSIKDWTILLFIAVLVAVRLKRRLSYWPTIMITCLLSIVLLTIIEGQDKDDRFVSIRFTDFLDIFPGSVATVCLFLTVAVLSVELCQWLFSRTKRTSSDFPESHTCQ
jgi:hypothetical protein